MRFDLGYNPILTGWTPNKKEKKMAEYYKEKPFSVNWDNYATLEEATKAAKRQVMEGREDVVIRQTVAVVKFPVPDYEVETISV